METVRERRIALSDGAETTVQVWGEAGPLLVGIHGLGASRRGWERIGRHLATRYRLAAYDQRGHGDAGARGPMTFERGVADLGDVLDALAETPRALLGHSWGGAVAIAGGRRFAAERVAAIDPMLRVHAGVWTASVLPEYAKLEAQGREEREASLRAANASLPPVEVDAKLHAARRLAFDSVRALGADNAIDAGRWDLRSLVHDYPKPLLVALADPRRSVVPQDERDEYARRGGPNVRIEVFAGASHSLQRDAFDRFAPVLEAFLA